MICFALRIALALPLCALVAGCDSPTVPPRQDSPPVEGWQSLEPGLELGSFLPPGVPASDDRYIRALRIDPRRFYVRLLSASAF